MKLAAILAAKGTRVFTIEPTAAVSQAVSMLAENNIGALIVAGGDRRPVGILSERDIIRTLSVRSDALTSVVADLMTSQVVSGAPDDDADAVLRTMTAKRFRHLPVIEDGKLVGMVTIGDLVKAQLDDFRGAVANLETRLMED